MPDDPNATTVRIMDREFKVKCPPEKVQELEESARYLDSKMRLIQSEGKIIGTDRIAVMAALNITHELISQKNQNAQHIGSMNERIQALRDQIEEAIQ